MTSYHLAAVCDSEIFGGAERMLEVLLSALPGDAAITVVGQDESVVARLTSARTGSVSVVVPPQVGALRWALRHAAPDVAHMNMTSMTSCRPAIVAALSLRIPVILVDHLPMPGLRLRGRVVQRLTTRLCAARVSVGCRSSRLVEAWAGLRAGTVQAIPNGIPALVAPAQARPPIAGRLRVGMLCRLVPDKGVDVLLRAMARVPEVTATIAGTGPLDRELRLLADALGLQGRVEFPGWVDPAAVLSAVDVVVLSSRREGLPVVLLEAMHAGLPVLATRVGSVAEAVDDEVTGLLVDAGDEAALAHAMSRLAGSSHLRSAMGAAGQERARQKFSADGMADAYHRLYVAAATGRGRAHR